MWAFERVFYQIYPLGFAGAPFENRDLSDAVRPDQEGCAGQDAAEQDVAEQATAPIRKVIDWIPHLKKLGIGAVYFSPVFESDTHGYNTRDYRKIDARLGSNADFANVCHLLHQAGIRVVLDGVFNHAGRGFFAFQDVLKNREASPYRDWFYLDFNGNSGYNDGLWYEGWEGHYDLVKLNLHNEELVQYLFGSIRQWIDEFDIDGLRLDVAYMVDRDFLRRLRWESSQWKQDFFLAGEILGGDYNQIMNDEMCHSVTNYECYKGLHSSFNSMNLFEINHSLMRQFGPEDWTLYRGKHLFSFVDNHDVSRIASVLENPAHLPLIYTMMFGMPGIPVIYYGSEWGAAAHKSEGDPALRACFAAPEWNVLTDHIASLSALWMKSGALRYGDFTSLHLTNRQCVFRRRIEGEAVLVAVNADGSEYTAHFDAGCASGTDLLTGETISFEGGLNMAPYCSMMIRIP